MNELTLGSLFDGSGGFPLAGIFSGIRPVWASEIEPFAIRVTTKQLPFIKHYGDISSMNGADIEPVDIITFGSPCFPAGTLILTESGYIPIEDVKPGMKVLTHKGRWMPVTAAGSKEAETVVLKGNHFGLECTPNHPIYSAVRENGVLGEAREWIPAENMRGRLWAVPKYTDPLPADIPADYESTRYNRMPDLDSGLFYFTGRWLGDGWVRDAQRPGRPAGQRWSMIYICDSHDKADELTEAVSRISRHFSVESTPTCVKVRFHSRVLCDWLTKNFGRGAAGKHLPSWVYSLPDEYRHDLMRGVLDSDGTKQGPNEYRVSTVSRKFAQGLRLLAETLGWSTTVYMVEPAPQKVIQGRTVNQHTYYTVAMCTRSERHISDSLHSWYAVKSVTHTGQRKTVYNLTVEGDNSYVAEGIVVHNCQDLSVAGKRAGIHEGARSSLFFEAVRVIKEMRKATNEEYPKYIVWENVPGALSSGHPKGADFEAVLENICGIAGETVSVPLPPKWTGAGEIVGDGFSVAWRILDAQYWGVPQRRKRIFLVADLAGSGAGRILFESEGMSGYSAEGFRARQAAAGSIEAGAGEAGGNHNCLTGIPLDHNPSDGRLTVIDDDVTQTLTQRMGTGGNNVPLLLKIRAGCEGGGKGPLLQTDRSATLSTGNDQTLFEPVVYGICSDGSNAMRSDNPHSGIYKAETTRTLDANGGSPACNQGGMVVLEGNGARPSHCGNGYVESDISYTLNATEQHGVAYSVTTGSFMECNTEKTATLVARDYKDPAVVASPAYGLGRDAYNQGQNAQYDPAIDEELQPPLIARGPGAVSYGFDPQRKAENTGFREDVSATVLNGTNPGYHNGLVEGYTVRRLTPTECARLQGFPDNWCANLGTEAPSEEEMEFWRGVFETHRKIAGTSSKPKTDNQIKKWLKDPHTDAAEYRLWGNGVALPCVYFVLAGIAAHHEGRLTGDET